MRKLFLTSAGLPLETRQYFLDILEKRPQESRLAFIPTAADPEEDKWFVASAQKELTELGFTYRNVDLKDKPEAIKKELRASDIIYINGGNTFYLLDWVRKCGLDKYLGQLIDNGKIYVGVSAGSILAGPDISVSGWDPSWDKNIPNLKDTTGLNFVPFAVSPHFTEGEREILKSKSKEVAYPITPITNQQAILVKGANYKIVGEGNKITL